jgi:hypothetical protein
VPAAVDIFDDLGDGEGGHYRWHGWRAAVNQPFNPALGPLATYLGTSGRVGTVTTNRTSAGGVMCTVTRPRHRQHRQRCRRFCGRQRRSCSPMRGSPNPPSRRWW